MSLFHIPTAFLIVGLLYLVMPVVTWVVLTSRRSSAVALWCGGDILLGVVLILFGLRGHVPEWTTFTLANLLMFVAIIQRIQSLRLVLAVPWRTMWMALAALLFVLGFEGIRLGIGDALLRLQYNQSIWAVMNGYVAVLAWRIGHVERSRSARWIAGVYLLLAVAMLYALIWMSIGLSPADPLYANSTSIFITLAGTLAAVVGNIAYVGLAFERSQRQTAEAEKQFHAIIATAKDGFYVADLEGRIVDVNQSYCDMTGYRRDELLAMRIADVEANENPEEIQAHIQHIMQAGYDRFETRHRCKDGGLLQIEASVNFLPFEGGKFVVFMRDITERKQAEQVLGFLANTSAMKTDESFFNQLARYLAQCLGMDFVCIDRLEGGGLTARTLAVWCDGRFEDNVTYALKDTPCGDVVGRTVCCFPSGVCRSFPHDQVLKELLAESYVGVTLWDYSGRPIGLIAVIGRRPLHNRLLAENMLQLVAVRAAGEIERLEAEVALRESLLRYELVLEGTADGFWDWNIVTGEDFHSPRYKELLGYGPDDLLDRIDSFEAIVHPDDLPRVRAAQKAHLGHGAEYNIELRLRTKQGDYKWFVSRGRSKRDGNQKPIRMSGSIVDITERKKTEEALRESEAKFRLAFSNVNAGMCLVDLQGKLLEVNEKMSAIFGYGKHELESMTVNDFTLPEDARLSSEFIHQAVQGNGDSATFEKRYRHRLGNIIYGQVSSSLVRDAQGQPRYFILQVQDITERRTAEAKLMDVLIELQLFRTALDNVPSYIYTKDTQYRYTYANQPLLDFFCRTAETLVGCDDTHFFPPETVQQLREIDSHVLLGEQVVNETDIASAESGRRIYWDIKTPIYQTQSQSICGLLGISTDITELKNAEAEIKQLAFYDPLTQLPNRRLLLDRLQQALSTSVRSRLYGALLFIDLDDFKTLNDTLGHDKGDLLLQEVASRISGCVRGCDTVARLGGDEFVVMLTGLDGDSEAATAQTKKVGSKILDRLNQVHDLTGHEHYGSASIGITLFVGHSSSMDELLKQADIALYQAKAAGRNALRFFDAEMQLSIAKQAALANDLRQALAKKQFQLFCQIEASHNHKIIGAEALLRWHHPERGPVPPQEFISLAEKTGLIQPIGQWVLESACALLKSWEKSPEWREIHLAVNISVRQFHQPDFVDGVLKVLQDTGFDPCRLMLELTESVALANVNDALAKMNALKQIGVRFSLDDFGTGFSSLAYLARLPFDQLKIDRSFVQNIGVKLTDEVIIQAIIAMANKLGIGVVAEGVETEAQRAFLEQHGCPVCQGYLFGKPVPLAEFEDNFN